MPVHPELMTALAGWRPDGDWESRRQLAFMIHTYCFDFPVNGAKS